MDYIYKSWAVMIDITNMCKQHCIYCSRHLGHVSAKDRYAMTLDQVAAALDSLEGWPNAIGIIGGEPLLHPQFREIAALAARRVPKAKLSLFTSGLPNTELEDPRQDAQLQKDFGKFYYNPHNAAQVSVCRHQPLTIAVDEAVPDKGMMWKLINGCWLPRLWSPGITAAGAYFCEVAASLDMILHQGKYAWKVEPGWWQKPPEAFQEQISELCPRCGMCLPMERQHLDAGEKFSPRLLEDFRAHGAVRLGGRQVTICDRTFSNAEIIAAAESWYPSNYREDIGADHSLAQWYKGIQMGFEPDPCAPGAFHLDTEAEFTKALAGISFLEPEEEAREFAFYYHGRPFYPLREPYPFVLPERPVENMLYFRAMLLHYRQILDDATLEALRAEPLIPPLLTQLGHRYRMVLAAREKDTAERSGRRTVGKAAPYWEPRERYLKPRFASVRERLRRHKADA